MRLVGLLFRALLVACPGFVLACCTHSAAIGAQQSATIGEIESDLAWLINTERAQAAAAQLQHDAKLSDVARQHSQDMRDRDFVGHQSPVPGRKTPMDRYTTAFGAKANPLAENVSMHEGVDLLKTTPAAIHGGFMASPKHRANLLAEGVTRVGIGCATDGDGAVWTTQLFAGPEQAPAQAPSGEAAQPTTEQPAAKGAPAAAQRPLALRPVRTYVWPRATAAMTVPVRAGDSVRWGITSKGDLEGATVSLRLPSDEGALIVQTATSIHETAPLMVFAHGQCRFAVSVPSASPARFIAIVGPLSAVTGYGQAPSASVPLQAGKELTSSLGDGVSPDSYTLRLPPDTAGRITITALDAGLRATCALYAPSGEVVSRGPVSSEVPEWGIDLAHLQPGVYTLVVTDPAARPGASDYRVTFIQTP